MCAGTERTGGSDGQRENLIQPLPADVRLESGDYPVLLPGLSGHDSAGLRLLRRLSVPVLRRADSPAALANAPVALGQYLLLCAVSFGKTRWSIERFEVRLLVCLVEILLCLGVTASLNFYYSGAALLVLADLVHYVRNSFYRVCFTAALILLFSFGRYEILYPLTGRVAFSAYLDYYNQTVRSLFAGTESLLVCLNVLLFVLFMILLFTGQKAENSPHTEAEQAAEPGQRPPPGLRL